MPKPIIILGIETSCDETAASVLRFNGKQYEILSHVVASQIPIHKLTGGVVPEVAAREHVTTIIPVIKHALQKAKVKKEDLAAIAVTAGPGLMPALMVGVDTANALSKGLDIPVIPVQHITGHIYANFLKPELKLSQVKFPLLALAVSGGHSEFILMKDWLKFKKIGFTLDDAAGECFDKSAKVLGLPYPGGPQISKHAESGNPQAFAFPRPLMHEDNLNFSYAGLKTAILYKYEELKKKRKIKPQTIDDLAASVQAAIIDTIVGKTLKAVAKYKPRSFTMGGGVAANKLLRETLFSKLSEQFPKLKILPTIPQYATDNASMIAAVGAQKLFKKESASWRTKSVKVSPQWELK